MRFPAAGDQDRRLPAGGPAHLDGLGPGGEARRRTTAAGRTPGRRPGREGDLRARATGSWSRPRPARSGCWGWRTVRTSRWRRPRRCWICRSRRPRTCWNPSSTPRCWSRRRPAATATTTWSGSTRVRARSGTSSHRASGRRRCRGCSTSTWPRPRGVYAIERPGDRLVDHLEATEYPGLRFTEGSAALDWLYTEASPLLACVRQAAGTDRLRRAVDLLWAAKDLTESGANSHQYETTARAMCDATRAAGDARAEGRARTTLTDVLLVSGRIQQAAEQAQLAMELAALRAGRPGHELGGQRPWAHLPAPGAVRGRQDVLRAGDRGIRARSATGPSKRSACATCRVPTWAWATSPWRWRSRSAPSRPTAEIGRTLRLANGHLHPGHRADQGRPSHRGAQPVLRRPGRLRQPPAAALGGDDPLPDRRGAPGRPPPRAGRPARRAGPRARLHRRRPDAGHMC